MKGDRDDIDRLLSLLDAVEESILRMPDDEVRAELAEEDQQRGQMVGEIVQRQLTTFRKKKLEAAKRGAARAREAHAVTRIQLPGDPAFRRMLLDNIIANDPGRVPKEFTLGFRDGKKVTDAEIDSAVLALITLGVIDENGRLK